MFCRLPVLKMSQNLQTSNLFHMSPKIQICLSFYLPLHGHLFVDRMFMLFGRWMKGTCRLCFVNCVTFTCTLSFTFFFTKKTFVSLFCLQIFKTKELQPYAKLRRSSNKALNVTKPELFQLRILT